MDDKTGVYYGGQILKGKSTLLQFPSEFSCGAFCSLILSCLVSHSVDDVTILHLVCLVDNLLSIFDYVFNLYLTTVILFY